MCASVNRRTDAVIQEALQTVPQSGEVNEKFGVYKSVCCGYEIVVNSDWCEATRR